MVFDIISTCLLPVVLTVADVPGAMSHHVSGMTIYPSDSCMRGRPDLSGPEYLRSKPHVLIHYTTEGEDSTTLGYAESVAVYAETSWVRTERMGWYMPAPDGSSGGDSRYDFYIEDPANIGYPGLTWPEDPYSDPFPDGYTAYTEVSNAYTDYAWLSCLVAHEFHHGSQKRYSAWEAMWWYENTSVFMEDMIFDDVNTLAGNLWGIRPNPLLDPHRKYSEDEGGYEYAGGLWALFLHEYYGSSAMLGIWNRCGYHEGNHSIEDTDYSLTVYNDSDLKAALSHYALWRYFCGNRDIGDHFEEGWMYPDARILRVHTAYPASGDQDTLYLDGPGGCNFIQLANLGISHANIYFDGINGYEWAAYVVGINYDPFLPDECYEYKILLDASENTGTITVPCWDYDTLVIIPVVTQWNSAANDLTYTYSVSTVTLASSTEEHSVGDGEPGNFFCPTPATPPILFNYRSQAYAGNVALRIYDAQGRLVRTISNPSSTGNIVWEGCDQQGNFVRNGVYYCVLKCGAFEERYKVIVIK